MRGFRKEMAVTVNWWLYFYSLLWTLEQILNQREIARLVGK
jgi:hypothetical protein